LSVSTKKLTGRRMWRTTYAGISWTGGSKAML
jgi:hypothetical protein